MFKNYFKIAWRSIWKNSLYSSLNIIGLSFGLASVMTLIFVIYAYYDADAVLKNKEQLYYLQSVSTDGETYMQTTYPLLGEIVKNSPEIEAATHIQGWNSPKFSFQDKKLWGNTRYVDTSFFQVFTLPLKYGDPETALDEKFSVVISEDKSQQLFGDSNPMGKTIQADDSINLTVTGVLEPLSNYASIDADILLNTSLLMDQPGFSENANWYNSFAENYIKLKKDSDIPKLENRIKDLVFLNYAEPSDLKMIQAQSFSNLREANNPMVGTILTGAFATAFFVLLIVLVNLLNLNTSIIYSRTKEIAIRKITGGRKRDLLIRFCIENGLIVFISMIMGLLLFKIILLPGLNEIIGNQFGTVHFDFINDLDVLLIFIGLGIVISLIAGILPSLKFVSIPVATAIKGKLNFSGKNLFVRNTFITIQFALAIIFICMALVLNRQIDFMKNSPLGFNENNVSLIPLNLEIHDQKTAGAHFNSILNKLRMNPYVKGISTTSMIPSAYHYNYNTYYEPETGQEVKLRHTGADVGYVETYQISLAEGENFRNENYDKESPSIMINQKAMEALGWKSIKNKYLKEKNGDAIYNVVGVMEDFHYQDMQRKIEPLLHWNTNEPRLEGNSYLSIRIDPAHKTAILNDLKNEIKNAFPESEIESFDIKEKLSAQYTLIEGILKTVNYVAFLAIIISCLGMFGLISLIAKKRVKEIGIRKTLGASAKKIVFLLSKDFIKLVLISALLALPLTWLLMTVWLQDFAYRIDLHWWIFAAGGIIALAITSATVGFQAIKAALANPVKSLRTE
ncbi:ABC transporter permease [Christiangramia sp.]|uniref:ABC transporter permease n=1 Tax=Christiangramia sp. TaxID=1931228 RepID=UPI00260DC272|nr:ABC transporter permease [Christiangramia sp.]